MLENADQIFQKILEMRVDPKAEYDQRHLTRDSMIRRIKILKDLGMLERRTLAIGDSDLMSVAISIYGNPPDVLIADIDERISEVLFEISMTYDLPVRFVYHDMRIKLIEILLNQFSLIILEPPQTKAGVEVFLSRAIQSIQDDNRDGIFISVPHSGEIRNFFHEYIDKQDLKIINVYELVNEYTNGGPPGDLIQLEIPISRPFTVKIHWLDVLYEREENSPIKNYRCACGISIVLGKVSSVSEVEPLKTVSELYSMGCPSCGQRDNFVYESTVPLK